jgi:hypothetical protein
MKNTLIPLVFVSLLFSFSLVGCGTKSLSAEDKIAIRTISISPENIVYSGERLAYVVGNGSVWAGAMGGAIGSAMYAVARDKSPDEVIWATLQSDSMLRNVLAESFQYQFSKSGTWQVVPNGSADAHLYVTPLIIQIVNYGEGYKLVGAIRAELRNKNGAAVWNDSETLTAFNGAVPENSLPALMTDKARLAGALSVFGQILAGEMIEGLGGRRQPINPALGAWSPEAKTDSNLEGRLQATKELFEKGLITEDEYKRKKQDVIDKM